MTQSNPSDNPPPIQFDADGNLPPGVHVLTLAEAVTLLVFNNRRTELFDGFLRARASLQQAGCQKIYIGGSFATNKELPGDFDACWDTTNVNLELLKKIEPALLDLSNNCAAQKAKFGGELFPADLPTAISGVSHLEFFQEDRDGRPKGIICIN
jgi:hypothetical protein